MPLKTAARRRCSSEGLSEDDDAALLTLAPQARMEQAVRTLLTCLGEDPAREGLLDTPKVCTLIAVALHAAALATSSSEAAHLDRPTSPHARRGWPRRCWTRALATTRRLRGARGGGSARRALLLWRARERHQNVAPLRHSAHRVLGTAFFHEPIVHGGGNGLVLVRDIDFASTSEETLLPFHGRAHIGYVPRGGVVLGLSKLARLTRVFAKRLQSQERLGLDLCAALGRHLRCQGVAVVLQATHLSMGHHPQQQQEGQQQEAPRTTACVSGRFADPAASSFHVRGIVGPALHKAAVWSAVSGAHTLASLSSSSSSRRSCWPCWAWRTSWRRALCTPCLAGRRRRAQQQERCSTSEGRSTSRWAPRCLRRHRRARRGRRPRPTSAAST